MKKPQQENFIYDRTLKELLQGKKNAKLESAYIMVTKYHLPISQIAQDFKLNEEELINYIYNKNQTV